MNKYKAVLSGTLALVCFSARAAESPKERVKRFQELQEKTVELHAQVVKAPNDRALHRRLLTEGLVLGEFLRRSSHSEAERTEIVELKQAMNDMFSIQKTIQKMELPVGLTGEQLANRLKKETVPYGHQRKVPMVDPWGTPYRFFVYPENGQFKIVSAGRGRKFDKANFGLTENELRAHAQTKTKSLDDNIVFIDGANFTKIYDYPKDAQTFLYTLCEPADEPNPDRHRCW